MTDSDSNLVAVVIPIYKAELTDFEQISFQQCLRVLGSHPILLVKPQSLNLDHLLAQHPALQTVSFDDSYFKNIAGYNRLLMAEKFYQAFSAYEFILIHQLDAFVFRDELSEWCQKGFDYIGAPILTYRHLRSNRTRNTRLALRKVLLNGGLSLRRVAACSRFLWIFKRFYGSWKGNEDGLFSLHYPRLYLGSGFLKLPSWEEALPFAFEQRPALCYTLNHQQLPLGCHAWERYDLNFWKPFFVNQGYEV